MQTPNTTGRRGRTDPARSREAAESGDPRNGSACLNCGATLRGPYCHRCGQEDRDPEPTLGELTADLLEAALNWDSRLLVTLRHLLFRPGRATAEYNAGRRASYVSPLRLYVVVSVLFLTAATLAGGAVMGRLEVEVVPDGPLGPDSWPWLVRGFVWSMFLLVPAFAGLLKLLYVRSGRAYVHHLVLAVHYHAFAFLVLTPVVLLVLIAPGSWLGYLTGAALLWIATWLPLALRRVHGQGWMKTSLKAVALLWLYFTFIVPLGSIPMALLLSLVLGSGG